MTADEVMKQLEKLGTEQTRKTFRRHGCTVPLFGVKVGDMKTLIKKTGKDAKLAKELYKTGNPDAQYFAGLIAHGGELTAAELEQWAKKASWQMVGEYTVAWMAAEHPEGWPLALKWIDSPKDEISSIGWNTLSGIVSLKPDAELDLPAIDKLLKRVAKEIQKAPNRTKYTMNGFVISVGSYVIPLSERALEVAAAIGDVEVDMGETECKLPDAGAYIQKIIERGTQGRKKKTVKC